MNVFRHDNERVDLESAFSAIAVHRLQEKANIILNNKQSSALPG